MWPQRCWFIDQRQQLDTDTDNLVGEVLANLSSLSLGSGIKHFAMMAQTPCRIHFSLSTRLRKTRYNPPTRLTPG